MTTMTLEQATESAILEYAPYYRQNNAALFGEHTEYVTAVILLHRNHYYNLIDAGAAEWRELPESAIQWLNENKPY